MMSIKYEDSLRCGNQRQRLNGRKRISSSSSPNPHRDDNYYPAHLIGARCYQNDELESFPYTTNSHRHNLRESPEKITEFERLYFSSAAANNEKIIRRGRSQSPSFMNRHSTFSSDSDSCSSISNMMTDCLGPEMTSSDSDDPEEVIYPEEQLNHVREFMARRSLRLMTEEQMSKYPTEGRGCVCSNSMDSGYKSFGASPDVIEHSFEVRSKRNQRTSSRFLHPDPSSEVPFTRCPITTNQRFMARYKNNSLDNRLNSSHLTDFDTRRAPMGLYEAKIANRIRSRQMDAHLDHLLHLRRTLMTAIQRVESTSPRSSRDGSPIVTSRSTSPAVTVIARNMKTITPNSSPFIAACNSPARSSSEVGVRPRRLLPTPGQRIHSSPKPFHSPQLNDIRRVIRTSKMFEEEKSGSSETSSVTSSAESTANSNSVSLHSSDVTMSSIQEFQTRNVPSSIISSMKTGNLMERQSFGIPRSETSGYSTGRDEVEQVSDVQEDDETTTMKFVSNKPSCLSNIRSSKNGSHFLGVSTLERNFKSLLSDVDDTRLVVDLENFNPSEVPEALKMRPDQEKRKSAVLEGSGKEVLNMENEDEKSQEVSGRIFKRNHEGVRSKTLMDEKENGSSNFSSASSKFLLHHKEAVCLKVTVPEGDKNKNGRASVSPRSCESTKECGKMRHPSSTRESIIRLEALSATNALMFKCAAAASINKHSHSVKTCSSVTNSPKARTIVPSSCEKETLKDPAEDVDHRKLSPPHINAILDKHLRRKKSRSACSTPKKPHPEQFASNEVN